MALADYKVYPDVDNLMAAIKQYDLFENVVELEAYGMTVVPPEKMQSGDEFVIYFSNATYFVQGIDVMRHNRTRTHSCLTSKTRQGARWPLLSQRNSIELSPLKGVYQDINIIE
jgi:hypothetical protein